jgi:putrescine aminotransferase
VTPAVSRSDETRLWHPFADMSRVRGHEFLIDRADDVWLWDTAGNRYLDGSASLWYVNVGHGRKEIVEAIRRQADKLSAYSIFGDYTNEPALALAERLAQRAPMPNPRVFLATGGGDAIETAAKLARLYWARVGEEDRSHLIGRRGAFHGAHGYGTTLGGIPPNRAGFGELIPDVSLVDPHSVTALEAEIERVGPRRIAAFFFEPVMGAGGVQLPAPGYLEEAAALCRRHGILLVADEIICAFGRLGRWFGVQRWQIDPDMIAFAKGVTSGYLPLGGVIVADRIAGPFWESGPESHDFRHGSTWAGHPLCCVAALENLDILEREALLDHAAQLERELEDALAPLAAHPLVHEVRAGTGVLAAIELAPDLLAERPGAVVELQLLVRKEGVLVRPLLTSIAMSPPLVAGTDHIALLADAIERGLRLLSSGAGRSRRGTALPA